METKIHSEEFVDYKNKISLFLQKNLEAGNLKTEELLAILGLFSGIDNFEELKSFVLMFSKSFPVLKDFLDTEKEKNDEGNEKELSVLTEKLIKAGKSDLANKIIVEGKNVSIKVLSEKFPEIKNYL